MTAANRSPNECHEVLARLAELAERVPGRDDPVPRRDDPALVHAAACRRCAGHLAAARANIRLLRLLPARTLPAAIPPVLDGILERAAHAGERELGPVLRAGLTPMAMPEPARSQGEDSSPLAEQLPRLLARPRTPGWLWSRVRADLRAQLTQRSAQQSAQRQVAQKRVVRRRLVAVAAGMVLSLGLLGGLLGPRILAPSGTEEGAGFVFLRLEAAPEPGLSPTGVMRLIGQGSR